jgi:conjugal transfer ATP-binding protein TraC
VHTVKGVYSEIYCITGRGAGIGRLVVDPFRALMYSTDAKDVHAIKQKQDKGMGIVEAIEAVLADRGKLS